MKKDTLSAYCRANPDLEIQDLLKYLYQSCFGCEHFVSDFSAALGGIMGELAEAQLDDLPEIEPLDGEYCRVHLKALRGGLSPEILCRLFILSARPRPDGRVRLEAALAEAVSLAEEGLLPFSAEALQAATLRWRADGFNPVHHSDAFRTRHHPAYRVIKKAYLPTVPVFVKSEV